MNSICSLGEGSSFGEGVIFGSKRETMIVTTDHCQLLCVDADHIRKIYEAHKAAMKSLVNFPGRPLSLSEGGSGSSDLADGVVTSEPEVFSQEDYVLSTPAVSFFIFGIHMLIYVLQCVPLHIYI